MTARVLMLQGTGSSVGKSLLVTALCRIFARRGISVAPFKAQNMSNNAAVCADGSEIGRSQALQAQAAGIEPTSDINPVLLKPEADARSQIILQGRPWKTLSARNYYPYAETLWPVVTSALDRLRNQYELVIIEGAGSPAELNLRRSEIVNMAVARYASAPVLLVGNIDSGGIFAQLLGTLWLLEEDERSLVKGLIVNKFRGDPSLFTPGEQLLEQKGQVPVLGVVPWIPGLYLPEEDAVPLDNHSHPSNGKPALDIAVICFPRIANFDDFDPLRTEPSVRLRYVKTPQQLGSPDALILPGTKSTVDDLHWLQQSGLAERMKNLAQAGTTVVGICGGYQMIGTTIRDPQQIESATTEAAGLNLLPLNTLFQQAKQTHRIQAEITDDRFCPGCKGQMLSGYEIHHAATTGGRPWLNLNERSRSPLSQPEGATSQDGRIWGCYLHSLFHNDAFRRSWLQKLRLFSGKHSSTDSGPQENSQSETETSFTRLEKSLDRLADGVEAALDMQRLEQIVWTTVPERKKPSSIENA